MPRFNTVLKTLLLSLSICLCHAQANEPIDAFKKSVANIKSQQQEAPYQTIQFEEQRRFPFKKLPVILSGEIRLWKDIASSVYYPSKNIAIISSPNNATYRKFGKDGKITDHSIPESRQEFGVILNSLFSLNFKPLQASYEFSYKSSDNKTSLTLTPQNKNDSKIKEMGITLSPNSIDQIRINFGKNKETIIRPLTQTIQENGFTQEEIKRFFPSNIQ